MEIKAPNESGSTQCIVRWMVETPSGWVGSYDREALEQFCKADGLYPAPIAYLNPEQSSGMPGVITFDDFDCHVANFLEFGEANPSFTPLYTKVKVAEPKKRDGVFGYIDSLVAKDMAPLYAAFGMKQP